MDCDHSALHVEERAAGVAAHERAVGSDAVVGDLQNTAEPHDGVAAALISAGVTEGEHPLADFDFARAGDVGGLPIAAVGDLHESGVVVVIGAERLSFDGAAVAQDECGIATGLADDVGGGHHVALLIDDDAGALRRADTDADDRGKNFFDKALLNVLHRAQVIDGLGHASGENQVGVADALFGGGTIAFGLLIGASNGGLVRLRRVCGALRVQARRG